MDSSEYVLALESSAFSNVTEKNEIRCNTFFQNMVENNLLLENFENLRLGKKKSDDLSEYVICKILVSKYQALETIKINEDYIEEINFDN